MTASTSVRYPKIEVALVGEDGNAYAILGRVRRALLDAGVSQAVANDFIAEATDGDYDHLLMTVMAWVTVT